MEPTTLLLALGILIALVITGAVVYTQWRQRRAQSGIDIVEVGDVGIRSVIDIGSETAAGRYFPAEYWPLEYFPLFGTGTAPTGVTQSDDIVLMYYIRRRSRRRR